MHLLALAAEIAFIGAGLSGPAMPGMVEAALRREAPGLRAEVSVAPWHSLRDHLASVQADGIRAGIAAGRFDVILLEEAGPIEALLAEGASLETLHRLGARVAEARETGSETGGGAARIWLYEGWPTYPGDDDPQTWLAALEAGRGIWYDIAATLEAAQGDGAPAIGIIPAGTALGFAAAEIAEGQIPGLAGLADLFGPEGQLNDRGSYLVAMVTLAALRGSDPSGTPARLVRRWSSRDSAVDDAMAAALQSVAWSAVLRPPPTLPRPPAAVARALLAPTVSPPRPASGIDHPNLALGLNGVVDWTPQQPFIDVFRTARPWLAHRAGEWGGWEHQALETGGHLDPDGWPLSLPEGATGVTTLVLTDLPETARHLAGRYRMTWDGPQAPRLDGRARNVTRDAAGIWFDFTPGPGAVLIHLDAGNPDQPTRNIRILHERHLELDAAGERFNPDWIDRIRGARKIRFMDWMVTNDSTVALPADRPRAAHFSWALRGVPLEVMVELANRLGADPWFNIPHLANDDLMREMALIVRDGLAPGLRAHIEYSNEVWNWQFEQARWAEREGVARWGPGSGRWVQYHTLRAARMVGIWNEVFGPDGQDRLVRVISSQTGWLGLEEEVLTAPLWRAEEPGRPLPSSLFDAYAVTGYFSAGLGADPKAAMVHDWLRRSAAEAEAEAAALGLGPAGRLVHVARHRLDLARDLAAAELADGAVSGDWTGSVRHLLAEVLPYHARVAARHGLTLMMYEGGTHLVGIGEHVADDSLAAFFIDMNYSAQMAGLYDMLLDGWAALTDAPFNAFVDVATPTRHGSWGGLRHLDDDNPRWQALRRARGP